MRVFIRNETEKLKMGNDDVTASQPGCSLAAASRRREESTWNDLVAPIVRRCKAAKNFKGRVYFDPDAADALAQILLRMAELLDKETAALRELDKPRGLSAAEEPCSEGVRKE